MWNWEAFEQKIVRCRLCPRLVRHRENVALLKRRQFRDWQYWGKPVPGFGDRGARLLVVGLAPAAHGANRTGRMFTGDRSGEWLYDALYTAGFANQPTSTERGDGLKLDGAFVTAIIRCAPPQNRPSRVEIERCRPFLATELAHLPTPRVVVALGSLATKGFLLAWEEAGGSVPSPRPRFQHGGEYLLQEGTTLLTSYHPSQQNTFTGRLTRKMLRDVFRRAGVLVDRKGPGSAMTRE
jgi:uracil-DNA glycosylase family 4